jgi:hypothetical protein
MRESMLIPLILTLGFLLNRPGIAPDADCGSPANLSSSTFDLSSDVTEDEQLPAPEPANDDSDPESLLERLDVEDDDSHFYVARLDVFARSEQLGSMTWHDSKSPSPHPWPFRNPFLRC